MCRHHSHRRCRRRRRKRFYRTVRRQLLRLILSGEIPLPLVVRRSLRLPLPIPRRFRFLPRHFTVMRVAHKNNLFLFLWCLVGIFSLFRHRFLLFLLLFLFRLAFFFFFVRRFCFHRRLRLHLLCRFGCFRLCRRIFFYGFLCRLGFFKVSPNQFHRIFLNGTLRRFYIYSFSLQKSNQLFALPIQFLRKFMYFHFRHAHYLRLLVQPLPNASLWTSQNPHS